MIHRSLRHALPALLWLGVVTCSTGAPKPGIAPKDPPQGRELKDAPPLAEQVTGTGLSAEFFRTEVPNSTVVLRTESAIDLREAKPTIPGLKHNAMLGARYRGFLHVDLKDHPRLTVRTSGQVHVWLGGKLVLEHRGRQKAEEASVAVPEGTEGPIPLLVEFHAGNGKPELRLYWESDRQKREPLGAEHLSPLAPCFFRIPESSAVSPVFVEGTHEPGAVFAVADGKRFAGIPLSETETGFNLPLNHFAATQIQIGEGGKRAKGSVIWTPTPIRSGKPVTIRPGDSLLIQNPKKGTFKIEGPAPVERTEGKPAGAVPVLFKEPGRYTVSAPGTMDAPGEVLEVIVPRVTIEPPLLAEVCKARSVSLAVDPPDAEVFLAGNDALTVGTTHLMPGLVSAEARVIRRGRPAVLARVGGTRGPVLAVQPVREFMLDRPAVHGILVNPETHEAGTYLRLRPWIPGLRIKVTLDSRAKFADGGRTMVRETSSPDFTKTVDRVTEEPWGYVPFHTYLPPEDGDFCYDVQVFDVRGEGGSRYPPEVPVCDPPWEPDNICHVLGYQSLIFTRAIDVNEDEKDPDPSPRFEDFASPAPVYRCETPRPRPMDNPEFWKARDWPLMTKTIASGGSGAEGEHGMMYRLVVSDPEPLKIRLDNPIPALFGAKYKASECKACDLDCTPVAPPMNSGTIPGKYSTVSQLCEDDGAVSDGGTQERGSGPAEGGTPVGSFYVSKLDAHGIAAGTTDKFPDFAEVMPKLAGYVTHPVIRMDYGGDKSFHSCSLYGTVCSPSQNEWQFTAIAKDPKTDENIPAGYKVEWQGLPGYQVVQYKNGQPLTIKVTLPSGRYFPTLKISGPDPATGTGNGPVGEAQIHSVVVEERPTCNVGTKNADVPKPKGTPFNVTNHIGTAGISVDMRARIDGSPHPHPDFPKVRGRVSLDGYPQNEYWVQDGDVDDLPQVVTVPPDVPQLYYLQGYQVASVNKDDLLLVIEGQAQLEDCSAATFFLDCTPCGSPPPTRYPVRVEWQETDTEPFNSTYPIQWNWDEPELKYEGAAPDTIDVQADNVADDDEGTGSEEGYYVRKGLRGRINFLASVNWEFGGVDSGYFVKVPEDQALKVVWNWAPIGNEMGGPNFCDTPTLRDLRKKGSTPDASGRLTAILAALSSHVQLDFTKLRKPDILAKSGDRFCIAPHGEYADSQMGKDFWRRRTVIVRPGDKVFHIVIPNKPTALERQQISAFAPEAMFDYSDLDFAQSIYKDWKWTVPLGSGETSDLYAYTFDRYRNVLDDGVPIAWGLGGGGQLGSFDPKKDQKDHQKELEGATEARGLVRIHYTNDRFPTCPWQMEKHHEPSIIYLTADGLPQVATMSVVHTDEPLPALFPPFFLDMTFSDTGKPDPANPQVELLDIAKGDRAKVTARLIRDGKPVEGIPIFFASSNGKLVGGTNGMVKTDSKGEASVLLTAEGATLDRGDYGTIMVTAGMEEERAYVSSDASPAPGGGGATVVRHSLPRWVSSAPSKVTVENRVLVSDAFGARFVDKDVLTDKGEAKAPRVAALGGTEGDDRVRYPIYDSTQVTLKGGLPNHQYHVSIARISTPPPGGTPPVRAEYPMDVVAQGKTPNKLGPGEATVGAGIALDSDHREGNHALRFSGTGTLSVPSGPAVDASSPMEISFWVKPEVLQPAVLLSRPGQYELAVLPSGKLLLSTWSNQTLYPRVESQAPLAAGNWNFVQVIVSASGFGLAVGPDARQQTSAWGAPAAVPASQSDVEVGRLLVGLLDDLVFNKDGLEPPEALTTGLVPGSGAATPSVLMTDAAGNGQFRFQLKSQVATDYRPVTYVIRLFGSPEESVEIQAVPKDIWGALQNVGRAFIIGDDGLGEHPAWYEEAAAWASNMLPFLSSLRTLALEIYKAATGCDDVSWMNVTFATIGLVADVATFGTAGAAVKASGAFLKTTFQAVLKQTLHNIIGDRVFHCAMECFVRLATVEVMNSDGTTQTQPAPWVLAAKDYLDQMQALIVGTYKELVADAFRSSDELFTGLQAFATLGAAEFQVAFDDLNQVAQKLNIVYAEPAPMWQYAYAPGRGPPWAFFSLEVPSQLFLPTGPLAKSRPLRSAVMREVFQRLAADNASQLDKKAYAGLRKFVLLVANGRRSGEKVSTLGKRIARALNKFSPQESKLLLHDMQDVFEIAKIDAGLLGKVQDMARDVAARGYHPQALTSRTKGAAYALQEAAEGLRSGTLKTAAESIEPRSPRDNRLFRDLLEEAGGAKRYVELKALQRLDPAALGEQVGRHFERVGQVAAVQDLIPLVVKTPNPVTLEARAVVREFAVKSIMQNNGMPKSMRTQVTKWVIDNLTFEIKPLKYTPH